MSSLLYFSNFSMSVCAHECAQTDRLSIYAMRRNSEETRRPSTRTKCEQIGSLCVRCAPDASVAIRDSRRVSRLGSGTGCKRRATATVLTTQLHACMMCLQLHCRFNWSAVRQSEDNRPVALHVAQMEGRSCLVTLMQICLSFRC